MILQRLSNPLDSYPPMKYIDLHAQYTRTLFPKRFFFCFRNFFTWRWLFTSSFVSPSTFINSLICLGVATVKNKDTIIWKINSFYFIKSMQTERQRKCAHHECHCRDHIIIRYWGPPNGCNNQYKNAKEHMYQIEGIISSHPNRYSGKYAS